MITKECPMCETAFQSPRCYGKKYCSVKCRRRAKNFREARRTKDIAQSVLNPDSQFFYTLTNPTLADCEKFDRLVASEMSNDKPVQFIGLIPETYKPSTDVVFQKQQKLNETDPDIWVMFHPAMID